MAAPTCVDLILHNLDLLKKDLRGYDWYKSLDLKLKFLRTFLVCATKWRNKNNDDDVCILESSNEEEDNKKKKVITLHSFLSNIEDEVNKYGTQIQSLCLRRKETESVVSALFHLIYDFHGSFNSFKQEIVKAYIALLGCSSSQSSNSCIMRGDELVDFIDLLVQNLMDLRHDPLLFWTPEDFDTALHAQIEALQDKLTFLKNFISFAKLQAVENGQLPENLLIHIQVVALNAARLSYTCSLYPEDERAPSAEVRSLISELVQTINPVDSRINEIYINVLRSSKSSPLTHAVEMDKQIIGNFNDSLISCLWELLWSDTSFADFVKDQMKLLYEGLRFLRTILMEPVEEIMDKVNEDIRAVIAEAGVIILTLSRHRVQTGDTDSLELRRVLVDTNRCIKLIEVQKINSGALPNLPSDDNIKKQVESKTSALIRSEARTSRIHDAMVDLHDEVKRLKDRLVSGSNQLEIVPIVGMPGLGKTTLAKSVYSNPSIKYHFHISLWCLVSQSYSRKNVLLQILGDDDKYSVTNMRLKQMDESDLLLELYQKLKKNKYLVIFDDVWDIAVWNELRMSFSNDHNGSRILITSRFSNVASQVGKPHNLRLLTCTESWELLQKKVFGKEDCPEALRKPGMEIAKNCKGLPLTVVVIAGILATVEYEVWEEVGKSLASTIVNGTDQCCKNTLELSYVHLPSYLKPCLLYFGTFPEDEEIRIRKLMWLWMAEGFVQSTESKRLEDVAEEYLMDLIGRNLIMVSAQRSMGGVKACHIHDLVHEFCKVKAKEENFLQLLHGYDELSAFTEPPNLERLSISSTTEEFNKSRVFCPHARSLVFFNHIEEYQTIADVSFIFCIYKLLRVLNIGQILLLHKEFPREIASLVQLRYLAVRAYKMNSVPPVIANLTNLETFLLRCVHVNISLPDTILNLKKLRHLHFTGLCVACLLPAGNPENTSSLDNLDTFSSVDVFSGNLKDIVKRFPNLQRLGLLEITEHPFRLCNPTLAMDSLSRLKRLESLKVSLSSKRRSRDKLPSYNIEYCFPSTLRELSLENLCIPWSKISVIEDLPNLEVLKLLGGSFVGERWEMKAGGFPKLRFLKLEDVDVVEWTDNDAYDYDLFFPCLEKLVVEGEFLKIEKAPSCLYCIPTLQMIEVEYCLESLVREIEKEQKEYGNENLKIQIMERRI